jgi:hypothetical protein
MLTALGDCTLTHTGTQLNCSNTCTVSLPLQEEEPEEANSVQMVYGLEKNAVGKPKEGLFSTVVTFDFAHKLSSDK